jgi:hypothetical protein
VSVVGHLLRGLGGGAPPSTLAVADNADGTGAVATISATGSGAAVTLYRAAAGGRPGPLIWTASGTRTGNGTIPAAVPVGPYWWYAVAVTGGGSAVSGLVYQPVTSGPPSPANLWDRIVDAAVVAIQGLALPGMAGVDKLRNQTLPKLAGFPCIVASCFGEAEVMLGGDAVADEIGYPVLVTIVNNTMNDAWTEDEELAWRGAIRGRFAYRRLDGVPEVTTCTPEPLPAVAPPLATPDSRRPGADRLDSKMVLRFVARVTRGAG